MAASKIQGMAETCATTGNPAMYCMEPEVATPHSFANSHTRDLSPKSNSGGPHPVDQEPVNTKRPDATTFDIVKATQYGAIERVRDLVRFTFFYIFTYKLYLDRLFCSLLTLKF